MSFWKIFKNITNFERVIIEAMKTFVTITLFLFQLSVASMKCTTIFTLMTKLKTKNCILISIFHDNKKNVYFQRAIVKNLNTPKPWNLCLNFTLKHCLWHQLGEIWTSLIAKARAGSNTHQPKICHLANFLNIVKSLILLFMIYASISMPILFQ